MTNKFKIHLLMEDLLYLFVLGSHDSVIVSKQEQFHL